MKGRNYQIHEHGAYVNIYRIVEITMIIVRTETGGDTMFYAYRIS